MNDVDGSGAFMNYLKDKNEEIIKCNEKKTDVGWT